MQYSASRLKTDKECAVIDILADLRHYCGRVGFDFDNLNRIAGDHYEEEGK